MKDYEVGFVRTYIHDHGFDRVSDLTPEEVIRFVKLLTPTAVVTACVGSGTCKDLNLTNIKENGWLNKLFLVVMNDGNNILAINRHDDEFGLYLKIVNKTE